MLNAVTVVQVGAQVSGIISKIFVDFNTVVKKGQVIAQLDTTLLFASSRDAAAGVQKANAQATLARKQLERSDLLFHDKVISQSEHEIAVSAYNSAAAELMAMRATLDHEKTMLKYATIKAPINGTVISRNVDVGQTVNSSFNAPTLFTIANDLSQMQVLANVDEADIGQVKVGQQTTFSVDAFPYDMFKGQVAMVRLQPLVVLNVNNYIVVINVSNSDLKLLPGLTANVTIKVLAHQNVLRIPVKGIHFLHSLDDMHHANISDAMIEQVQLKNIPGNEIPKPGSNCYVWVKNGTIIRPVFIQVGLFDGSFIEISGDLKKGDEVLIGTTLEASSTKTTNNPFMPKMPTKRSLK